MTRSITVAPVGSRRDRRAFRLLPHRLYLGDPHWVAPPHRDIRLVLDPQRRHPFYGSGDIAFFLARRGSQVVGRIAAIENHAHERHHGEKCAFFGFFETEPEPEVASALLGEVASWGRARGKDRLRGPCSPSLNYECGLLVRGEPGPPFLMMPHNPLWYADRLEEQGLRKVMDLYALLMEHDSADKERWLRFGERIQKRHGATLRSLDLTRFHDEVRLVAELFNDAWSRNWGFVPLSERELDAMAKELKPVIVPELCKFVLLERREIGFHLMLPDYNRVLIRLRGRLLPFGFLALLRARRRLPAVRVLLMGIRREFQHLGLDGALYADIVRTCVARGIVMAECSWVLETNRPMINAIERAGGRLHRTYRLFEKPL